MINTSSYRLKFGQGANLGLGIGYAFNKNISCEITGNTQLFSKFKLDGLKIRIIDQPFTIERTVDLEYVNTMFQVSPQLVFKSNPYNHWTFYLKGGPDFIWVRYKETTQTVPSLYSYLFTIEHSGNINTGIQCSFGTEYKLSKTVYVFAELTAVNVSYTFKRGKALRYGIYEGDLMSAFEIMIPDGLNDRRMFNHIGLNVGLKYLFW